MPYNVIANAQSPLEAASFGQFAVGTALDFARVAAGPKQRVVIARKVGKNSYDTYVVFDCTLNENYQHEAQPTSAAIDSGSVVTDHVFVQPAEITLTGIVSDTPLGGAEGSNRGLEDLATQGVVSVANAVAGPLGVLAAGVGKLAYNALTKTDRPSIVAYLKLYALMYGDSANKSNSAPELFKVTTGLRTYENMVIRSMSVPRDATTGNALIFNLTLVQLNIVEGQSVSFALAQKPTVADAPKEKKEVVTPAERRRNANIDAGAKAVGEVLPK